MHRIEQQNLPLKKRITAYLYSLFDPQKIEIFKKKQQSVIFTRD